MVAFHQILAAVLAIEDGKRNAPLTLTGNAPVVALADHSNHALLAPLGVPADIVACADGVLGHSRDRSKPLLGRAVNDGLLASPAMRVRVDDSLGRQQRAALTHVVENGFVGGGILHAGIRTCLRRLIASAVHRHDHADVGLARLVVFLTDIKVVCAESGRGMNASGTGIRRDMLAVQDHRLTVKEGVLCRHQLKERAFVLGNHFIFLSLIHISEPTRP